jgi:hypothetical protein
MQAPQTPGLDRPAPRGIGWFALRRVQSALREPAKWGIGCMVFAVLAFAVSKWPTDRALSFEDSLDTVHESGQLVALNLSVPDEGDWWGRFARFFAVLAFAAFGFEVIRAVSWSTVERLRIWWRRMPWLRRARRIAIIGSTARADWLAHGIAFSGEQDADAGRTLVTQVRENAPTERPALGPLLVITEPIVSAQSLASLDVDRADQIVISCDDDAVALGRLNAVLSLPDRRPPGKPGRIVRVQLQTPEVLEQVRSAGWDRRPSAVGQGAASDVRIWNPDEIAARRALGSAQLDWRHSFARAGGRTELFCIGFGGAGRLLASALLRQAHHVDESMCRITVIDEQPARAVARFRASHSRVDDVARIDWHQLDAFDPAVRAMIHGRLEDSTSNVVISVAVGDVDQNLAVALGLVREATQAARPGVPMPVFVRQSGMVDVTSVFGRFRSESSGRAVALVPWGGMEDSCRPEDVLESRIDRRAERLHATYLANNPPKPGDASNPLSSRRPWRELWSYFRDDNRNRADFLEARLRAVGLRIADAGQGGALVVPDQLEPREREILARLEHRRWVVSRLLAGWTRGPRDDAARRHPSVCPWSELSDTERAKDDVAHDVVHALAGGERLVRG